jgi:hypothetical protein
VTEKEPEKPYQGRVILERGQRTWVAEFLDWEATKESKARRSMCSLFLGHQQGVASFSVSHGYGTKEMAPWRIREEDQDKIIAHAASQGRIISKTPRSTGRKRVKRAPKVDPRQLNLGGVK